MGIFGRIASWLEDKAGAGAHKEDVGARVLANASISRQVLRFQGRYECGCDAPEGWKTTLVADECPLHGGAKVFKAEEIEVQTTQTMAPKEIFE